MAMINNPNQPDYTGARAHDYIDQYTNRPEDAGTLEGLQNLLGGVGMVPGIGEPADLLNALIYGAQGEGEQAGLSLLSMLPFVGGLTKPGKKAWKGTDKARKKWFGRKARERRLAEDKYFEKEKTWQDVENIEMYNIPWKQAESVHVPKKQGSFFKNYLKSLFDDISDVEF